MKVFHKSRDIAAAFSLAVPVLLMLPSQASAYLGPGLGAGTLGVILGLLGSIILALFAFFWYPIKRMLFGNKAEAETEDDYANATDETLANEAATKTEDA